MIEWLKRLLGLIPTETVCVDYADGDALLRADQGWRLSPKEDRNYVPGVVWLERDVSTSQGGPR